MSLAMRRPSPAFCQGYEDGRRGCETPADWGRRHSDYKNGFIAGTLLYTRLWGGASELRSVEVLPGLELDLLPGEDVAATAEQLSDLFAEIESCPWLGDQPTDDEIDAMFLDYDAKDDPAYTAWLADGAPLAGATWSGDYSDVVSECDRDEWVGV